MYLCMYEYIQDVTKSYGTNFMTHSSHLEDEIMLYEHGSGNELYFHVRIRLFIVHGENALLVTSG